MREFLYLFTWGFYINNDFVSFSAPLDFVDKITDFGIYDYFSQPITSFFGHANYSYYFLLNTI